MANEEHLTRLRAGVNAWNAWRLEHPHIVPDLSEANLGLETLPEPHLSWTNIGGTGGVKTLFGLHNWTDIAREAPTGSYIVSVSPAEPNLGEANLSGTNLAGASLRGASLAGASLSSANLQEANLEGADLGGVLLRWGTLDGTNLGGAKLSHTMFVDVDLSKTKGLEACIHLSPSSLDYRTLQQSSPLPLGFLRGCGLSDWEIEAAKLHEPGLTSKQITDIVYRIDDLRSTRPIQIHRLFISYSHVDSVFLEHMEKHLIERGIRFWRDIHNAPAGPLENIVIRAISDNPTVLLVLSENSVKSDWVEYEAQTARELEKELGRHVLCPVALDESWKTCKWSAVLRNQIKKYNVLNFSDWQDATAFEGKFQRLLSGIRLFYGDNSPFP